MQDRRVGKDMLNTGAETATKEDGSGFYASVAEKFNDQNFEVKSVTFRNIFYQLEEQYSLPPPTSDELKDTEQIKNAFTNARSKLSKVWQEYRSELESKSNSD